MKALLVPGMAVLLLAAGTIAPAAAHIVQWQEAEAAYDAAVARAEDSARDNAAAREHLTETMDAATLNLEDASSVASAGTGYLAAAAVTELTTANTALSEALDAEHAEADAMPDAERPGTPAGLRDAAAALDEWSEAEATRASAAENQAGELTDLSASAQDAAIAAANSVSTESGSAFGVAPIATPETRSAVEVARDALVAAASKDEPLAGAVTAYAASVEAMFASQRAEAEAAAAEEASRESAADAERARENEERLREFYDNPWDDLGYDDESDCTAIPNGWVCGL